MTEINLEEILKKHRKDGFIDERWLDSPLGEILSAMKEACLQTLELASEEADADYNYHGDSEPNGDIEVYVLKQSILQLKDRIK